MEELDQAKVHCLISPDEMSLCQGPSGWFKGQEPSTFKWKSERQSQVFSVMTICNAERDARVDTILHMYNKLAGAAQAADPLAILEAAILLPSPKTVKALTSRREKIKAEAA